MSDLSTITPKRLRPYDSTLEDNLSMYDRLPYCRDSDLCNKEALALISGNVIKYYHYNNSGNYKIKS
jgi:hypothetical protein